MANQNELKIRPMALTRRDLQLFLMLRGILIILLKKSTQTEFRFSQKKLKMENKKNIDFS